ncbi:MAG: beta-lactamase family protein [Marinobacter sp.]|nr:beta-lactamase family protein [Marinobacter sp.]
MINQNVCTLSAACLALGLLAGCDSSSSGPTSLAASCASTLPNETDQQAYLQLGGAFDTLKHVSGEKMTRMIDNEIRKRMCDERIAGLGLGLVWHGNLVYVKGYGWARGYRGAGDNSPQVMVRGQRTRFRWASVSKTVTGLAASIAAQEVFPDGSPLFDLDSELTLAYRGCDDLGQGCVFSMPGAYYTNWDEEDDESDWSGVFLLSLTSADAPITVRMLLANRSGIMHYGQYDPGWANGGVPSESAKSLNDDFGWAIDQFTSNPLLFLPGTRYNYSSFGFNMAGTALDIVTEPVIGGFWPYVAQRIASKTQPSPMVFFHPDDLYDPQYQSAPWYTAGNRASGYYRDSDTNQILRRNPIGDVSWKLPGGGFISTVADMALYAEGLLNYRFLSEARSNEMWTPQEGIVTGGMTPTSGYALGFNMSVNYGERMASHNGRQQSSRTRLVIYPDGEDPSVGKLAIVLMSNSEYADLPAMADAIDALLREPLIPDPASQLSILHQSSSPDGTSLSFVDGRGRQLTYLDPENDFLAAPDFRVPTGHSYNFSLDRTRQVRSSDPDMGQRDDLGDR